MPSKFFKHLSAVVAIALAAFAQSPSASAQEAAPYSVYDSSGNQVTIEQLVEALAEVDVVFIGEMHDDAAAHKIEQELFERAYARYMQGTERARRTVVLSLEMFERDVQLVLDEYLAGLISERHFLASSRPWKNYQTDYKPLVEFARAHKIPVIAANAPARYVSRVSQNGPASLASLSREAREWLPPLPVAPASSAYAKKFTDFMQGETGSMNPHQPNATTVATPPAQQPAHGTPYLLDSQNLRDAAMAYSIVEGLKRHSRPLILHVNGNFHSEERMGVPEHVRSYRKKARLLVVTTVAKEAFDAATMSKLGDFIVLTRRPAQAK